LQTHSHKQISVESLPEPSPESLSKGELYVCAGGIDITNFDIFH